MTKALSSWSGMRKFLEQDMLSPCLHGRIRYGFQALLEIIRPKSGRNTPTPNCAKL